ncbi:MAG: Flp pilus assembly protein CpaB [Dehalococcoidia bacterium]|nr:Flp pilus assembly protein CpaB [Dehalococcoidia bacterium]
MGRKRGGCLLMALGVVVALIAGGIAFYVVTVASTRTAEVPTRAVLVAAVNIPERTLINASMLRVQQWPPENVPPGSLNTIEAGANKFSTMPIFVGQAVLGSQIADTKGGSGVAYALEPGKELVAVNLSGAAGIISSGAVRAGDVIDLIVNTPGSNGNQVAPTMQNLRIYAIGSVLAGAKAGAGAGPSNLFLFQVTPQDALILKFLETLNVDMVLRAAGDDVIVPTEPVTIDYLVNKYRLQRPPSK